MTPDLVELVEEKLTQEQWSPDQISGRLAKNGVCTSLLNGPLYFCN
jgi:IS30 family transposase